MAENISTLALILDHHHDNITARKSMHLRYMNGLMGKNLHFGVFY